jgi:hypothetical protein
MFSKFLQCCFFFRGPLFIRSFIFHIKSNLKFFVGNKLNQLYYQYRNTRRQSQACKRSVGLDIRRGLRQKFTPPFIFSSRASESTNLFSALFSSHFIQSNEFNRLNTTQCRGVSKLCLYIKNGFTKFQSQEFISF